MELTGAGELFIDGKSIGHVEGLTLSLAKFAMALDAATCEWPDVIIEDILDADVIDC